MSGSPEEDTRLAQWRARPATNRAVAPGRTCTPSRESNRIAPTSESPTRVAPIPANRPGAAGVRGGARAQHAQAGGPGDGLHCATLSDARTLALVESAARKAAPTPRAPGMRDPARIESRCRSVRESRAADLACLPPEHAAVMATTRVRERARIRP